LTNGVSLGHSVADPGGLARVQRSVVDVDYVGQTDALDCQAFLENADDAAQLIRFFGNFAWAENGFEAPLYELSDGGQETAVWGNEFRVGQEV
jgi:hypothetical protein